MVRNWLCRMACALYLLMALSFQHAYCAEQDPVRFITEFYTWYIQAGRKRALGGDHIYRYVERETVEEIKIKPERPGYDGTDYFIKLSDTPPDMKGVSIVVSSVENISADTIVALVTIVTVSEDGHRFPDGVVVVVMKHAEGALKILKCIDIYPEA